MTMSRGRVRQRAVLSAVTTLILAGASAAYDSKLEGGMRLLPATRWRAHLPYLGNDDRFLQMRFLKDTIGGSSARPDARFSRAIVCPEEVLTPGGTPTRHCRLATSVDIDALQAGWLTPRLAGERAHESEHTLIAREAARRAGLLRFADGTGPYIFQPFWVRYPARDALIGSTIPPEDQTVPPESLPPDPPPVELLLTQSLRPVSFLDPHATFAARSVALLELAQLPDFSNSLADWAAGNEACPLPGMDSTYQSAHALEACHQFQLAMGAINVTHFAPLNREMWRYYHRLALNQMAECRSYVPVIPKFYTEPGIIPVSETEVHECERLAMAYEMFAQHFLQDAWSSGHMWMGWGATSLDGFPSDVELIPNQSLPPAVDIHARKAVIAGLVGAARGMIHGTKGLTVELFRESTGSIVASVLERLRLLEDPLNGGSYTERLYLNGQVVPVRRDVRWGDTDSTARFPGAGDLYWDPLIVTGAVISKETPLEVQRERLLNCSAKSMLDVYSAGPNAHGEVGAHQGQLDEIAADGDSCWDHWVENSAMVAALDGFDNQYLNAIASSGGFLRKANEVVLDNLRPKVKLAPGQDTKEFLERVAVRLGRDLRTIRQAYVDNARAYPTGFHSAHQNGYDDLQSSAKKMSLLGVPPVQPSSTSGFPGGVDYVDGLPSDMGAVLDDALSRMFWRGDLRRSCEMSGIDVLKRRCVEGARQGGDPEACSACVAAAELHVPPCSFNGGVGESKCAAIGAESYSSGVPGWFFDGHQRRSTGALPEPFDSKDIYCDAPYVLALEWCTDTPMDLDRLASGGNLLSRSVAPYQEHGTFDCGEPDSFGYGPYSYGTSHIRGARFLQETPPIVPGFEGAPPWIYPMAVAYDYSVTTRPSENPCELWEIASTSRDSVISRSIAPGLLEDYWSTPGPGAPIPRCGISQREFIVSTSCEEAMLDLGVNMPPEVEEGYFYTGTGAALVGASSSGREACWLREPRSYRPDCPPGFSCTAGGECVAGSRPPTAILTLDPPVTEP